MQVYTIGHSTRSIEEFLQVLKSYDIDIVLDVRKNPKFKYAPQFDGWKIEDDLVKSGISYIHIPSLGGFHAPKEDSINIELRNSSQFGFADYMETDEFRQGLAMFKRIAEGHNALIMCVEAVPLHCHRMMISDALAMEGSIITHIMDKMHANEHSLTPFLKIANGKLTYPKKTDI